MIDINNYILEKLHINKDYKLSFDFNDVINMIVDFIDKKYKWNHEYFTINTIIKSREDHTPMYIRFFTSYYTSSADENFRSNLIRYLYDNGIKSRIEYTRGTSGVYVEMKIYIIKTKKIDEHIFEKLHINKDYKPIENIVETTLDMTDYSNNDKVREAVKNWLIKFDVSYVEYITDFDFNSRHNSYIINNDYKDLVKYNYEETSVLDIYIRQCMGKDWNVEIDDDFTIYWSKKCLCFCWDIDDRQLNLYLCKK